MQEKRSLDEFLPNEELIVGDHRYRFIERISWKGKSHVQIGGQGSVAKTKREDGKIYAIKSFKPNFRKRAILERSVFIRGFSSITGMSAADNEVIDPANPNYSPIVFKYPFMQYAVIMPWVGEKGGTTWSALKNQYLESQIPIPTPIQSLSRSKKLAKLLNELNSRSIAHCDLCPKNMLIGENDQPYLIDLENFFYESFPPPPWGCPTGQDGYRHTIVERLPQKQYHLQGDRFPGALLIIELLTWHFDDVRSISLKESYFHQAYLQQDTKSYRVIRNAVERIALPCVSLFDRTWRSKDLASCPSMEEWVNVLTKIEINPQENSSNQSTDTPSHQISRRRVARIGGGPNPIHFPTTSSSGTTGPHVSRRVVRYASLSSPANKQTRSSPTQPIIRAASNTKPSVSSRSMSNLSFFDKLLKAIKDYFL